MANNNDDVQFSFDPKPFMKAMDSMTKALDTFEKKAGDVQKNTGRQESDRVTQSKRNMSEMSKTTKATSKGMTSALGKVAIVAGGVALAIKGIRTAMSNVGEIGQAFKIAGDIIMKNLFWPLRKAVMPYLQRMLDWVRDSRTKFVQWGQRIANVFRAVVEIVKTAWSAVKAMGQALDNLLGGRISEMLSGQFFDRLSFKIATVFIFARLQMEKMFSTLGTIFDGLGRLGTSFFDGLVDPEKMEQYRILFADFATAVGDLWQAFTKLFDAFASNEKVNQFFTWLGDLTSSVFLTALEQLNQVISEIAAGLSGLADVLNGTTSFKDWFFGSNKVFRDDYEEQMGLFQAEKQDQLSGMEGLFGVGQASKPNTTGLPSGTNGNVVPMWPGQTAVDDAILRKDGSIVRTNPMDTLVALKNPEQSLGGISGNNAMEVVNNITINASGITETIDQLTTKIREAIYGELSSMGVR